jgi:hypothetical protein
VRIASPHAGVYSRSTEPGRIVADDLEWLEYELLGARARLRERLYDHERHTIDGVIDYHGVPPEQRNALAHALYQADVEFWETVVERTKGNPYAEPPMLLGHEGKSTDERNYQKGFSLKLLAEAIGKVSWPEIRL